MPVEDARKSIPSGDSTGNSFERTLEPAERSYLSVVPFRCSRQSNMPVVSTSHTQQLTGISKGNSPEVQPYDLRAAPATIGEVEGITIKCWHQNSSFIAYLEFELHIVRRNLEIREF